MSGRRRAFLIVRLILAGVVTLSPRAGSAFDGGGRTFELQRDLRRVRPRVERGSKAAGRARHASPEPFRSYNFSGLDAPWL